MWTASRGTIQPAGTVELGGAASAQLVVWKGTGRFDENAEAAVVTASIGSSTVAAVCQLGADLIIDAGDGLLNPGTPLPLSISLIDGGSVLCNASQLLALKHHGKVLSLKPGDRRNLTKIRSLTKHQPVQQ